jgi:hypothetical protein
VVGRRKIVGAKGDELLLNNVKQLDWPEAFPLLFVNVEKSRCCTDAEAEEQQGQFSTPVHSEWLLLRGIAGRPKKRGLETFQVLKRIEAGVVAVFPRGLDGITPDKRIVAHPETGRFVTDLRLFDTAHDVRLTAASRARAMAPHVFERKVRLCAVVPDEGQFIADELNVNGD